MAADEQILLQIKVDNDQAVKQLDEQNQELIQLEKNQKKLAEQQGKNSKAYQLNAQRIKKVRAERNQNIKAINAEKGSLNELRANLAKLTTERNKLDASSVEGARKFKELNEEILSLNDSIKEAEESGGDFRRSVGNYGKALDGASGAAGQFGISLDGISQIIKLNPIGLLVTGLIALVTAFSKTEKGAKFFKIALAVINTVFETLVGSVGTFAEDIINAFSNPVSSIQKFANLVQNYVLEKVNALIDTFGFLGDVIKKVFEGDFDGAVESAKKAGESFLQANPYVDLFEASAEAVSGFTDKVVENVEATIKLEDQNYNLQRSMLGTQKQIAALEGQEASLQKQSEDSTLSFQEQAEAQEQLQEVQLRKFKLQESLVSQEISIINQQLAIAKRNNQDTLALQQELTTKQLELINVRNEATLSETENLQITRQRNQDIWEQELDFIIDVGEKEREVYAKLAEDESLSIEERKAALANYQLSYQQFLNAQRSQFEDIGLSDEELNRLLGIKDPAELAQAITDIDNLSEVEKNRLREVLIEFKNAEFEKSEVVRSSEESIQKSREDSAKQAKALAKKQKDRDKEVAQNKVNLINSVFNLAKTIAGKNEAVSKAIGITQAVINTATGITKAFAELPYPAAIPAAISVAATGAAQVSTIASAGSGSNSVSAPSVSATGTTPNTSRVDTAQAEQEALENAISNLGLTVSVTEINDAQSAVTVSEQTATI